jgi:tetratricopeptide (TPR) repeat protein
MLCTLIRSVIVVLWASSFLFPADAQKQQQGSSIAAEFQQALSTARSGNERQALVLVDRLLEAHPAYVPALKLQGTLLEDADRSDEAMESYQKGLKLDPADADLEYKVGVYKLVSGDREGAVTLLEQHLRHEPNDPDALYYIAQAYHLTGHDDRALKAIRECLKLEPSKPPVWQKYGELLLSTGDSETGFDWLMKAQQADPSLPRIDFDLGVASLNKMEFESAAQYAQKAIALNPDDAEALELLAATQMKLSNWQGAIASYERILALINNDRDALLGLGRCQLELKQYQAAVDTLTRLLTLDPAEILGHYYLGRAYAGLGNAAEAQHQADLHHRMMEQSSFAASALGTDRDKTVWAQAGQLLDAGHEDAAVKLFEGQDKETAALLGHAYFLVGALYLYMGKPDDGLRNLHRALQVDPRARGAHTYLGIYDLQQSQLDEAEKQFSAEIANDPNYETAIAELGLVRYRQQRWAEAADQLSRSRTRAPALLLALSDSYFHLGRVKDADLTAEIAAAYARDNQELIESLVALLNVNGQTELAQRLSGNPKQ